MEQAVDSVEELWRQCDEIPAEDLVNIACEMEDKYMKAQEASIETLIEAEQSKFYNL